MADAHYSIPEAFQKPTPEPNSQPSFEAQQTATFKSQLDAQYYSPEAVQSTAASFMAMSDRLDSYRNTAEEIEQKNRPWLKAAKSLIIAPKPILADLIEKESIIIGKLVQAQNPNQENRIWVQNRELFYGFIDKKHNITLDQTTVHYHFDEYGNPFKSFNGRAAPFFYGEIENLTKLLPVIEPAVMRELYPVDEAIEDLMHDEVDTLEGLSYLDGLAKSDDVSEPTEKVEIDEDTKKDDFRLAA